MCVPQSRLAHHQLIQNCSCSQKTWPPPFLSWLPFHWHPVKFVNSFQSVTNFILSLYSLVWPGSRLRSSEQSLYTDPSSNLKSFWLYCKLFWGCSTSAPSVYQVSWISGCVLNNYWELISVVSYVSLIFHPVFLWYNSNRMDAQNYAFMKKTQSKDCVCLCVCMMDCVYLSLMCFFVIVKSSATMC